MIRQPVSSSNISSIGYDESDNLLEIEFSNGIYQYYGVPKNEYLALMSASSIGRYFSDNIRDMYQTVKVS